MTEKIADLVNRAARDLSDAWDEDYPTCKLAVMAFVGVDDESQLHRLEIEDEATAATTGLRHWKRSAKGLDRLDVAQALGSVAAFALPDVTLTVTVNCINAGLYFLRLYTKATTVKIDPADASVLWALHRLHNRAAFEPLLAKWGEVVAESTRVDATVTMQKLRARLENLAQLGCVRVDATEAVIIEAIRA